MLRYPVHDGVKTSTVSTMYSEADSAHLMKGLPFDGVIRNLHVRRWRIRRR